MEGVPKTAVTPAGIRDGDPAALRGLVSRRGRAVVAFCEAVCPPDDVDVAAAEAFARFRAAVAAADDPGALNPEALLLGATRHAAASMARPAAEDGLPRGPRRRAREREPLCPQVPGLLAARAEHMLGPADLDRLAQHLDVHLGCREVEAAFRRAERAYRSPPHLPLHPATEEAILGALAAAAPLAAPSADAFAALVEEDAQDEVWASEGVPPRDDDADAEEWEDEFESPADLAPEFEFEVEVEPEPESVPDTTEPVLEDEPGPPAHDAPPAVAPPTGHAEDRTPATRPARRRLPRRVRAAQTTPDADRGTALPRPSRTAVATDVAHEDHGPVFRVVLPGAAIAVAIIIILAIAGVFGGDTPAPTGVAAALLQRG